MKWALLLLLAFLMGFALAFLLTQWRVGAAQAREALYVVGATEAFEALDRCTNAKNGWFKR